MHVTSALEVDGSDMIWGPDIITVLHMGFLALSGI